MRGRLSSFKYAFEGIKSLWKSEANMRIHFVLLASVICLACFFAISRTEWILVVLSATLVLVSEALNTSIEKVCDFMEPNINPKIKTIKDVSAAAVLFAALGAFAVGCIIFLPKIIHLFAR